MVVSNDDLVYVADRSNNRFQVFRLDGTFVREAFVNRNTLQAEGTVHTFALSRDPAQRYLYVADGSNKAIHILDRQTLTLLDSIGGHGGHNAREFFHLHSLASQPDSEGESFCRRGERRPAILSASVYGHGQTDESRILDGDGSVRQIGFPVFGHSQTYIRPVLTANRSDSPTTGEPGAAVD